MNYDITELVKTVISLVMVIIVTFIIPYIKVKVESEKISKAMTWVNIAVEAAEMIYTKSGMGKEKKSYVTRFLKEHGFVFDDIEIDNMIESAVFTMKKTMEGDQ